MPIGYDDQALYNRCLLDLPMNEGVGGAGAFTQDIAAPHHPVTLSGPPAWTQLPTDLMTLEFLWSNPDFLVCAAADCADLDFTTEDFTGSIWINPDDTGIMLLVRGLLNADGWYLYVSGGGALQLYTNQAAANQATLSANGLIVPGNWYNICFTRAGADVLLYVNGLDVTDEAGTHVNPLTSARDLHIGIHDDETSNVFDGTMWRPRLWDVAMTPQDIRMMLEMERQWFGV